MCNSTGAMVPNPLTRGSRAKLLTLATLTTRATYYNEIALYVYHALLELDYLRVRFLLTFFQIFY